MTLVRLAKFKDIDALTKMRFNFSREYNDSITDGDYLEFAERCTDFLRTAIASHSNWRIWVAESEGEVVSHVFVQIVHKVPRPCEVSSPFGYVTNVYTLPEYRGKGIGGQIQAEVTRWSSENKLDFLIVWPSENSVEFYSRNGFAPCREAMEWFDNEP